MHNKSLGLVVFGPLKGTEMLEDAKGVIIIHQSKKDRQYNGQTKKYKKKNNNLQNTTQKSKERATRIPLKSGGELMCPEWLVVPASLVIPVVLLLNDSSII